MRPSLLTLAAALALALGCSSSREPQAKVGPSAPDNKKPGGAKGGSLPTDTKVSGDKTAPAEAGDKTAPAGADRAEGQGFVVVVKPPTSVAVGSAAVAQVELRSVDGFHVNAEFPTKLTIVGPDSVEIVKAEQTIEDATKVEETLATFDVKFTPKAAGDKKFSATFMFAVCTEETCNPNQEQLAWSVSVK